MLKGSRDRVKVLAFIARITVFRLIRTAPKAGLSKVPYPESIQATRGFAKMLYPVAYRKF